MRTRRPAHGFTLVELVVVVALVGLMATLALPAYTQHLAASRRADAVAALLQLQMAQERHHQHHGVYAGDRQALRGAGTVVSAQGFYDITLAPLPEATGQGYVAEAVPRAGGPQQRDSACPRLTLTVRDGVASRGPHRRCWIA